MGGIILVVVFLAAFGAYYIHQARKFDVILHMTARKLGWTFVQGALGTSGQIQGTITREDGTEYSASIDRQTEGSGQMRRTYVRFRIELPLPPSLELLPKKFGSSLMNIFDKSKEFQIHSAPFDRELQLKGENEAEVLSYFHTDARNELQWYFDHLSYVFIREGTIEILEEQSMPEPLFLLGIIERLPNLIDALLSGGEYPWERLSHHIEHERGRDDTYRRHCLRLLLYHYPETNEAAEHIETALRDSDRHARLIAVSYASPKAAFAVLKGMLEDENETIEHRITSLRLLAQEHDRDKVALLLRNAAASPHEALRKAAIHATESLFDESEGVGGLSLSEENVTEGKLSIASEGELSIAPDGADTNQEKG